MTLRPRILALAALVAVAPLVACQPTAPPKPATLLPPLVHLGGCVHTTEMTNKARCVILDGDPLWPGYWVEADANYAYFRQAHGTGRVLVDPS